MFRDPIVEEVRRIREANAARFDYDIDRIAEDARQRQEQGGRKIIRAPRQPRTTKKRKRA